MTEIVNQLTLASRAVLEALPQHLSYRGPSANALAAQIEHLAAEVQKLIQALWGIDVKHTG